MNHDQVVRWAIEQATREVLQQPDAQAVDPLEAKVKATIERNLQNLDPNPPNREAALQVVKEATRNTWLELLGTEGNGTGDQPRLIFRAQTVAERLWAVDRGNPNCFLSKFVGNDKAVKRLSRAAFMALGRRDHCCADQNIALLGPCSTGKTTVAKLFAQTVGLPFIELHPKSIHFGAFDILPTMTRVLNEYNLELTPTYDAQKPHLGWHRLIPPCVCFIDEVHALSRDVVDVLLKATEKNDGVFDCGLQEVGSDVGSAVDCRNICWIIATTERGMLLDAFDSRFTKVFLELYSKDEIAQIVQLNHPDWDLEICRLVAKYAGRVPREALAFATEMTLEAAMHPDGCWEDIADQVAADNGIDQLGMTKQRVQILTALGQQGPISQQRLAQIARCHVEELENYLMPCLLDYSDDGVALVRIGSKGYEITEAGLEELEMRGIKHRKME